MSTIECYATCKAARTGEGIAIFLGSVLKAEEKLLNVLTTTW